MNATTKRMVCDLLTGNRMITSLNIKGKMIYKMFTTDMKPLYYVHYRSFKVVQDLMKKDKNNWLTLNLSLVRQLHGKSWIKQQYKLFKK